MSTNPLDILLTVHAIVGLLLAVWTLSLSDLVCQSRHQPRRQPRHQAWGGQRGGQRGGRRRRLWKLLVALPLMLLILAALAFTLFAMGMSHGSRPSTADLLLVLAAGIVPIILLGIWCWGSLLVDGLWVLVLGGGLVWLTVFQPALYARLWADDDHAGAQLWMAQAYADGSGGVERSRSMARVWYRRAAGNGSAEAQMFMADTEHRPSGSLGWLRLAAAQGEVEAMLLLAAGERTVAARARWLERLRHSSHPDAVFLRARALVADDLAAARRSMRAAGEGGSRPALRYLLLEAIRGGPLFGADAAQAARWRQRLADIPASVLLTAADDQRFEVELAQADELAGRVARDDTGTLFRLGSAWLAVGAADEPLLTRARDYLGRAADRGHAEAAWTLAKARIDADPAAITDPAVLARLEQAARAGHRRALERLISYYKGDDEHPPVDLKRALDYQQMQLRALQADDRAGAFERRHAAGDYRDTERRIARQRRIGGTLEQARAAAVDDPDRQFALGLELLDGRRRDEGRALIRAAAEQGSVAARAYLAVRTLQGPRSFDAENAAIGALQAAAATADPAASLHLALWYSSRTIVPRNLYLARRLARVALPDPAQAVDAQHLLEHTSAQTDSLVLDGVADVQNALLTWFEAQADGDADLGLLVEQLAILQVHFQDERPLRRAARAGDAAAQFELGQYLLSRDLPEAIAWMQRAADGGHTPAQYELARRVMRRSRHNPPSRDAQAIAWLTAAADAGHIGAMVALAGQLVHPTVPGVERDRARARRYYRRALDEGGATMLYSGRHFGRVTNIERHRIKQKWRELEDSNTGNSGAIGSGQ